MPLLTALVLGAFAGYGAAWYFGFIHGDFELLLLLATVVTGAYWVAERTLFRPRRRRAAKRMETARHLGGRETDDSFVPAATQREQILAQPWWLDWTAGLFPVILIVFLLRAFVFEPFKIPSGSMIPTLRIGDLILVNKFTYGLKMPVLGMRLTAGKPLQRGDVVVFRYPVDPNVDYIKRVIGLPGDTVAYLNKRLSINGQEVPETEMPEFLDDSTMRYFQQFSESLTERRTHEIIINPKVPALIGGARDFPGRDACVYSVEGVRCTVPQGQYFMMGDNRDNSLDSRYWGFVPEANIIGKAFMVWMNFGQPGRIGTSI